MSIKQIAASGEVVDHFDDFLAQISDGEKHLVVEKSGEPMAALISMKEYTQFRRWLAQQIHHDLGRRLGAEFDRQGITEENLAELMEEDRAAVYRERYG